MNTDLRRWGVAMCGDPFGLESEATLQGVEDEDDDEDEYDWAPGALFAEAGGAAVD
jgi:hypothetical protein